MGGFTLALTRMGRARTSDPCLLQILIETGHLLDNIPVGGVECIKTGLPLLVPNFGAVMELGWGVQLHPLVYGAYVTFVYIQDWWRLFAEMKFWTYKVPWGHTVCTYLLLEVIRQFRAERHEPWAKIHTRPNGQSSKKSVMGLMRRVMHRHSDR